MITTLPIAHVGTYALAFVAGCLLFLCARQETATHYANVPWNPESGLNGSYGFGQYLRSNYWSMMTLTTTVMPRAHYHTPQLTSTRDYPRREPVPNVWPTSQRLPGLLHFTHLGWKSPCRMQAFS